MAANRTREAGIPGPEDDGMLLHEAASWDDAETGIARAIDRICDAMRSGFGPDPDAADVQRLVDALLDERPARSTLGLEQRLISLCRALEDLGPAAGEDDVVARAREYADRWN
jgi:hypothetical protein